MGFLDVLNSDNPTIPELTQAHLELEDLQEGLQAAFDETYRSVITQQQTILGGGQGQKKLSELQKTLEDAEQKLTAAAAAMETIRGKMGNRLLLDTRHRLTNEIPSAISSVSEERRGLWREFLSTYAKAAILYSQIKGSDGQIPTINFNFAGLSDGDRVLFLELLKKAAPKDKQPSCDSRIDGLSREAAILERSIDEFDPPVAVAEVLQKAGSKAYQLPAEPEAEEYVPETRPREEWAPEQCPDPWAGEEGKERKAAYYNSREYEDERTARYEELLSEPEPVQTGQESQ